MQYKQILLFFAIYTSFVYSQQYYNEYFRTFTYKQPSSKPLIIEYVPYYGIYELTLKPTFDPTNQDKLVYDDVASYCIANQRRVQLNTKTQVNFSQIFGNSVPRFMDQVIVNSKVYLTTNNFDIYQVNLDKTKGTINQNNTANTLFSSDLANDFLIKGINSTVPNQNVKLTYISSIARVLAFSNQRAFHFSVDDPKDLVNVSSNAFKQRSQIFNVYERNGYILVASGKEGIDIYNFTKNENSKYDLVFVRNLQKNIFNHNSSQTSINITDLDYITSGSTPSLYVLDFKSGLYDYKIDISNPNISSITSAVFYEVVQQYGGITFDVQNNNLFIMSGVYETNKIIDQYYDHYIMEIVYYPETQKKLINRELKEKYKISEVFLTPHYTFVLGQDIHSIIYQGVNSKLVNNNYLIESNFIQLGLFRVDFLQSFSAQKNYMMGLSRYYLTLFELNELDANIYCSVDNPSAVATGTYNYTIKLISSVCPQKTANSSDTNPLSTCFIYHNLTVNLLDDTSLIQVTKEDMNSEQQRNLAIGLGVGLTLGVILIIIVSIIFYRYYKPKLEKLQKEIQLRDKRQYQQISEDTVQTQQNKKIDFV